MIRQIRKWWAVFSIYFQDGLAYRASGLIWITTDLVTAVTMPLVWASAAHGGPINGFSSGDFVLYYLCMLMLGSFITSHMMWDLAFEVREGVFTTSLIRPISFFQVMFFRNLSWRIIRSGLFGPFFVLLLFLFKGYVSEPHLFLGWQFWASLILGNLVSFSFVMMMSSLTLFVTEAASIFELYYVPMLFLSGQLFPVSVLPQWARNIAVLFPFYYTTGAPTEILIGRIGVGSMPSILATQVVWVAFSYLVGKVMWAKGLKFYTGVGM